MKDYHKARIGIYLAAVFISVGLVPLILEAPITNLIVLGLCAFGSIISIIVLGRRPIAKQYYEDLEEFDRNWWYHNETTELKTHDI